DIYLDLAIFFDQYVLRFQAGRIAVRALLNPVIALFFPGLVFAVCYLAWVSVLVFNLPILTIGTLNVGYFPIEGRDARAIWTNHCASMIVEIYLDLAIFFDDYVLRFQPSRFAIGVCLYIMIAFA